MPRRSVFDQDDETEINLSPMIDCIFILLIFFIVTTVFVEEQGFAVHKPDAAAPAASEEDERITLEITAENEILFAGGAIAVSDVRALVKANLAEDETPVVIRAHEKSDHGVFVGVWDAATRGGAVMLSFTTIN